MGFAYSCTLSGTSLRFSHPYFFFLPALRASLFVMHLLSFHTYLRLYFFSFSLQ
jgi:hypothetical protein